MCKAAVIQVWSRDPKRDPFKASHQTQWVSPFLLQINPQVNTQSNPRLSSLFPSLCIYPSSLVPWSTNFLHDPKHLPCLNLTVRQLGSFWEILPALVPRICLHDVNWTMFWLISSVSFSRALLVQCPKIVPFILSSFLVGRSSLPLSVKQKSQ